MVIREHAYWSTLKPTRFEDILAAVIDRNRLFDTVGRKTMTSGDGASSRCAKQITCLRAGPVKPKPD